MKETLLAFATAIALIFAAPKAATGTTTTNTTNNNNNQYDSVSLPGGGPGP